MIILQNSAIMKLDGHYTRLTISSKEFFDIIRTANQNEIKSFIGYPENAQIIANQTGKRIELSRENSFYTENDIILCMVLKYRVDSKKGKQGIDSFEYLRIQYKPL